MEDIKEVQIAWDLESLRKHFAPSQNWDDAGFCERCDPALIGGTTLKISSDDTLTSVLARYSSSNCPICRVFWNAFARFTRSVSQIKHFWFLFDSESEDEEPSLALLKWNGTTNSGKGFVVTRSMIPRDLESQLYWTSWREQLEYSMLEHGNFNDLTPRSQYMPTRLLDLKSAHGPVLVDSAAIDVVGPYVALSYCWGGANFIRTTTSNIDVHQRGIPTTSLPPLFRDIIQITLKLGLHYLWIDSLCIIQDSKLDWEVESAQMGQIFAQSFVVLAAGSSQSPLDELLLQRPEPLIVDTMEIPDFGTMPILAREPLEHPVWSSEEYLKDESLIHLQRRGWCYQEYWLAPRVLTILDWETILKCSNEIRCECGDPWNGNQEDQTILQSWRELTANEITSEEGLAGFWEKLVQQYTSLRLTQHTDRLPAFSGVAATFQRSSCGRYLAGLWEGFLPRALFWSGVELGDDKPFPPRPKNCRAPSWSWASVNGGVMFDNVQLVYDDGLVLECQAISLGKNPFGRVEEGFITLKVPVVSVVKFKELCRAKETEAVADDIEVLSAEDHVVPQ
ncbi:heterokaryon incompatibility protein-domain-containing protein [Microdochium bolleyi]|uniref:Heterokaryon incompatibility protein-domain-containing protein n=1 Tax=Microdochium bolleyi TaxID=196109 RepID=A0A136JEU1_9PEZI|nr:heterokaryon incompatibility protein-domain-containing protein [Microdochium bolleyi]